MGAEKQSEADEIRSNAAITEFLDYYVEPDRPFDYAVMISGPWGSGKTHLVKRFLDQRTTLKPLYVTLNGISSVEQIGQEFYRQLHPILSSRGMRVAGAVAQAMMKGALKMDFSKEDSATWNISAPEIDLTKDLQNPRDRLLVFDDLERCKMPVSEVLGYINGFVEHDGLKAILLANEDEIRAHAESRYDLIREKLIGQTLTVSAPAGEAFDTFLEQISDKASQGFLKRHRGAVLALHAQGGRGNLRTLKHAMWDFEKIGSQIQQRHWAKEESVLRIMKGVMAVTMEYRAGELDQEVLGSLVGNRLGRLMRDRARNEKSKAHEIDERYPQVDFDNVLIDAPTLGAILLRGEMDAPGLVAALDRTSDYAVPGEQPLCIQATQIFSCDDDTCELIAGQIEEAFAKREFGPRGEFLQIVGMRLWLSDIGLLSTTRSAILAESRAYIEDQAREDRLETTLDTPRDPFRDNTYGGFVIPEWGSAELREVVEHYDAIAHEQEKRRYPGIARELLELLSKDSDAFLFDLAQNTIREGRYWYQPVLASLPAAEYAKVAFEATPDIQMRAIQALHSRHDKNPSEELRPEREWIAEVKTELEKLMATARPMTRCRLQSLIARNLDPLLPERDSGEAAPSDAGKVVE